MSEPVHKPARRIACIRCRRTKKKCDHALPTCGQCSRAGAECRQMRTTRAGDYITVPLSHYQRLEAKAHAVERESQKPSPAHRGSGTEIPAWSPSSDPNLLTPRTPRSVDDATRQCDLVAGPWTSSYSDTAPSPVGHLESVCSAPGDDINLACEDSHSWPVSHDASLSYEVVPGLVTSTAPVGLQAAEPLPTRDVGLDITWHIELYANLYLAHVHRLYPILREDLVRSWMRTCTRRNALAGDSKGFILRLLCATGAFMCSSFEDDCPHLKEAKRLSQEAFERFHSGAMKEGPVVRAQVCLLTLHSAIYGPRPELLHKALASALIECVQLLEWRHEQNPWRGSAIVSLAEGAARSTDDTIDLDEHVKNIILACRQINEIIASGWDRPADENAQLLDDKLSTFSDRLSVSQPCGLTHLRSFHDLRNMQHKVRRFHEAVKRWGLDREAKNKWKAEIMQDVEDWRASVPLSGDESGLFALSSKCYTQKLVDYTVCLLHEGDPSSMGVEDLYALLAASSDACRKYRIAKASTSGIILRNWNALVYQFRVGVSLLYCFWATPASLRTPSYYSAESAVVDCSNTLLDFGNLWPEARAFHEAFTCLVAQTPFDAEATQGWQFPPEEAIRMADLIAKLRELRTHGSVLSTVEAIVEWGNGVDVEEFDLFKAIGLDTMNIFALGQTAYSGDLFSF